MMAILFFVAWFTLGIIGVCLTIYPQGRLEADDLVPLFLVALIGPIGLLIGILAIFDHTNKGVLLRWKP